VLGLGSSLVHTNSISTSELNLFDTYSVAFDGSGDYLDLGTSFQSTIRGSFTISCWVNFDDQTPGTDQLIFGSVNSSSEDTFYGGLLNSGAWYFYFESNNDAANAATIASGFSGNTASGWYHFACRATNNGGSNSTDMSIYVNGVLKHTVTTGLTGTNHAAFTTSDNLWIGGLNLGSTGLVISPLTGKMNDFAIFSSALDTANILKIYNNGSTFDLTSDNGTYNTSGDLVGYWKMEEGTGTTVADSSTNSNTASFGGNPQWDLSTP